MKGLFNILLILTLALIDVISGADRCLRALYKIDDVKWVILGCTTGWKCSSREEDCKINSLKAASCNCCQKDGCNGAFLVRLFLLRQQKELAWKRHSQDKKTQVWIRPLFHDSLEQNYRTRKEEKYRINRADRKLSKNNNLKYNKWLRKRAKNTGKTSYTYKICTATPDTKRLIYIDQK